MIFFYMLYVKCFDSSNKFGFTLRMIILLYNQPENERQEFVRHRSIKTTLTVTLFLKEYILSVGWRLERVPATMLELVGNITSLVEEIGVHILWPTTSTSLRYFLPRSGGCSGKQYWSDNFTSAPSEHWKHPCVHQYSQGNWDGDPQLVDWGGRSDQPSPPLSSPGPGSPPPGHRVGRPPPPQIEQQSGRTGKLNHMYKATFLFLCQDLLDPCNSGK